MKPINTKKGFFGEINSWCKDGIHLTCSLLGFPPVKWYNK